MCQVYASALPVAYGTRGAVGRVGALRAVGVASGVRGDACCWCVEGTRRGAPPDRLSNKSGRRRLREPGRWITEAVRGALHKFRDALLDVYKVALRDASNGGAWRDVGSEYPEPTTEEARSACAGQVEVQFVQIRYVFRRSS